MSFWKKLFGGKAEGKRSQSQFKEYKAELNKLGLSTLDDLENVVKPIIKKATKLNVLPASRQPINSLLNSHFGGQPYFTKKEFWPTSEHGTKLAFIFQVYNTTDLPLPNGIELIQFYYDWDEFPWDSSSDGWLVKIYKEAKKENLQRIDQPSELEKTKYCEISASSVQTLPDWEGVALHCKTASKLSCVLDENEHWDSYDQIITKLIGEQGYQSQIGGYPKWVQGESTPNDSEGNPMKLLFQIDSEDNAGVMWGDVGLIYVFYDEKTEKIEFTLQCH